MYTINLDLWKYGMSRDESICIYTNQVFEIQIFLNTYIRYRVDPNTDCLKSDSSEIRTSHSSVFNYWMFGIRMILDIFLHPISQLFIRISNVFQNWNPLAVIWTFFATKQLLTITVSIWTTNTWNPNIWLFEQFFVWFSNGLMCD